MRLRKNLLNLHEIVDSICSVEFTTGSFVSHFYDEQRFALLTSRRDGVGKAIIDLIPDNWDYRVSFSDGVVFLRIWI